MDAKELIKRYTHEVGRQLPRAQRADVQTELSSLLEDMLEERSAVSGRAIDDALAVDVLREFGEPGEVAQRYGPPNQYLVGPDSYPAFLLVMRIVLTVLVGMVIFSLAVGLWESDNPWGEFGSIILRVVPQFIGYAVLNLGIIALVFNVLERMGVMREAKSPAWDPRALPTVEDPNQLNRGEAIAAVCFSAALLLLFNLIPNWIDYVVIHDGQWGSWAVLSPESFTHLPWLNLSWLWEIGLNLLVLRRGRWDRLTRWIEFGSSVFSVVVLQRMIAGGQLMSLPIFTVFAKGILTIVLVIAVIEAVAQLYRLLTRGSMVNGVTFKPTSAQS